MVFFQKARFSNKQKQAADFLVNSANGSAISSFTNFMEKFPELSIILELEVDLLPFWDKLFTVCCVGVAFSRIESLPEKEQDGISWAIAASLEHWKKDAYNKLLVSFVGDFSAAVKKEGQNPAVIIGDWLLNKLKDYSGNNARMKVLTDSSQLKEVIGRFIFESYNSYWEPIK